MTRSSNSSDPAPEQPSVLCARRAAAPDHPHHPIAAGFRPAGMALALAAVFLPFGDVLAQPAGPQVIHGQASLQQQGQSLVVTTRNGPGTRHSAINWQSFSVPGGSVTHFRQPDAASTSINRVTGHNPTAIFGTLSSNGRLVVVNPAGIAVGAGAVVDTAGFTASTLRMSDADALAGRLMFGGDGAAGAVVQVDGQVLARSGDVVLIAPQVQVGTPALVLAPDGAAIVAAGQKVELTGRGLEGIRLQVQAPDDRALNLGTLEGDAVGIFAAQLKHTGLIRASGATASGGKVVLTATDTVEIAGRTAAVRGDQGGALHASARKVVVKAGAVVDVSGRAGGGEALIGGGWQGGDIRVANAQATTVETGSSLLANALERGDGGTVVVWADGIARVGGRIEARGGTNGGDGGTVETSGKDTLVFRAYVDTSAPQGRAGLLLLDPKDITVNKGSKTGRDDPRVKDDNILDSQEVDTTSDATLSQSALEALSGNVKLEASGDVMLGSFDNGALNMQQVSAGSSLAVTAGGRISGGANWIKTGGGKVDISTTDGTIELRGVETKGGSVSLSAGGGAGTVQIGEINTASDTGKGGHVNLNTGGASLKLGGEGAKISTGGPGGRGDVTLVSAGAVTVDAATTIEANDLKIVAGAGVGDGAGGAMWIDATRVNVANGGSGDVAIAHRGAAGLAVADLGSGTGVRNAGGAVSISSETGITFAADVVAGSSQSVSAGGALSPAGGVLKAD